MTTTEEVPMPATYPYVERLVRIFRDRVGDDTSAIVLLDFARAYADARCAKLQEAVEAARRTAEYWKAEHREANAHIDALAEKVKAMEDNDRRYRWLRTFPNNVRPHVYAPCGLLMLEEHLDAAIDAASGGGE